MNDSRSLDAIDGFLYLMTQMKINIYKYQAVNDLESLYTCQQDASIKLWKDIKEEYISKWVMIITIAGAFCAIILLILKILGR